MFHGSRCSANGVLKDTTLPVKVKVRAILPDRGLARFSLNPGPGQVSNAFVPLKFLQDKLSLSGGPTFFSMGLVRKLLKLGRKSSACKTGVWLCGTPER